MLLCLHVNHLNVNLIFTLQKIKFSLSFFGEYWKKILSGKRFFRGENPGVTGYKYAQV